jgi:hypothetical protein
MATRGFMSSGKIGGEEVEEDVSPGLGRAREIHQPGDGGGEVHGPDALDRVLLADARARGHENPPHVYLMGQVNQIGEKKGAKAILSPGVEALNW